MNFDPMGTLILEFRAEPDVANIVDNRVRGGEPAPGDATTPYQAFMVLVQLSAAMEPTLPIQRPRFAARCYGRTQQEAAALCAAAHHAIHAIGPRVRNDLGIYISHDETGGTAERDPDTQQPYYTFVFSLIATTQAVA